MHIVEKTVICTACLMSHKIVEEDNIKSVNLHYYYYLKEYNLITICEACFHKSYNLFVADITNFIDWLDENDNRETEDHPSILELKKGFDLSEDLLEEDPHQYIDNVQKYVTVLENKIVTEILNK